MTMKRAGMLVAMATLAVVAAASAQAADGPVVGHVSFGAALAQGGTGDFLEDGWSLHGGATWYSMSRPNFGIRLDFGVDWFDVQDSVLDQIDTEPGTPGITQPPDNGYARAWSAAADFTWRTDNKGPVGFYILAGAGIYYTQAALSETGYGTGYYCDPWWGYCYPGVVEGEYILADKSDWTWGLNAGAGLTFRTNSTVEISLEAVYHWLDTEGGGEFIPISLGVRW